MKTVILVSDEVEFFDTIKEAQEVARLSGKLKEFKIYTLYSVGQTEIKWQINTSHQANVLANKSQRRGGWSATETEVLLEHHKAGDSVRDIATKLHRSYSSVWAKLNKLL